MTMPTVLVIEDDPVTRGLIAGILRVAQFETVAVPDAMDGVRALRERRPDLIVMDLMLPGINGSAAAESLMADPRFAGIPILLLSGLPDLDAVAQGIGIDQWMAKPFNPADLVRTLRKLHEAAAASPTRA